MVASSSAAWSALSVVLDPSVLTSCGILSLTERLLGSRNSAALLMLTSSERKSSQCFFFCLRMPSWLHFAAPCACSSAWLELQPARGLPVCSDGA